MRPPPSPSLFPKQLTVRASERLERSPQVSHRRNFNIEFPTYRGCVCAYLRSNINRAQSSLIHRAASNVLPRITFAVHAAFEVVTHEYLPSRNDSFSIQFASSREMRYFIIRLWAVCRRWLERENRYKGSPSRLCGADLSLRSDQARSDTLY